MEWVGLLPRASHFSHIVFIELNFVVLWNLGQKVFFLVYFGSNAFRVIIAHLQEALFAQYRL